MMGVQREHSKPWHAAACGLPSGRTAAQDDRAPHPEARQSGRNAFAEMMKGQREQSRVHSFYLEHLGEGRWAWHWWEGNNNSGAGPCLAGENPPGALQGKKAPPSQAPSDSRDSNPGPSPAQPSVTAQDKPHFLATSRNYSSALSDATDAVASTVGSGITSEQSALACCRERDSRDLDLDGNKDRGTAGTTWLEGRHIQEKGAEGSELRHGKRPPPVWSALVKVAGNNLATGPNAGGRKVAVRLLTNAAPEEGGRVTWEGGDLSSNCPGPHGQFRGSTSLLKSALQKNVRLCRPEPAVRCALHLLKGEAAEFLRRFSIIMLEDGILGRSLPLLVWLMMAVSKGFKLGRLHATACLDLVHQVARVPVRDQGPPDGLPFLDGIQFLAAASHPHVTEEGAILVRCMLIRAAFGGMGGDVDMLRRYASLWLARFQGRSAPPKSEDGPWNGLQQQPGSNQRRAGCATWTKSIALAAWTPKGAACAVEAGGALCCEGTFPPRPWTSMFLQSSRSSCGRLQSAGLLSWRLTPTTGRTGAPLDVEERLCRAMWLFRSSVSRKGALSGSSAPDEEEEADKKEVQQLWQAAAAAADAFSHRFIAGRFA
eukprot:jgi/Botrbrau1/14154/Bobra.182_3s0094.1